MNYKSANSESTHDQPETLCVRNITKGDLKFSMPAELVLNSASIFNSRKHGAEMMANKIGGNYSYQRHGNANVFQFEAKFRSLEQAEFSIAVNSGMTAISLVMRAIVEKKSRLLTFSAIFYESMELIQEECLNKDAELFVLNVNDVNYMQSIKKIRPHVIFAEAPFNPSLDDIDIQLLTKYCLINSITLIVDNTVLTPLVLNPLKMGATITVYSLTKYINGHGDITGGMISTQSTLMAEKIEKIRNRDGLVLDPFSAWLAMRGIRTLPVRLKQHASNSNLIYHHLKKYFPSIPVKSTAFTKNAKKNGIQTQLHSGLIVIDFLSIETACQFVSELNMITVSPTFGNIETSCFHYGSFVESSLLINAGISPGLVRLSVGIENGSDLIEDITQAMAAALDINKYYGP